MKTIVCFGDSNTWGYDPVSGGRYAHDMRWTGVLAQALGDGYRIVEEGLNGRTTVWNDPLSPGRCGIDYLIPCLYSHAPIDLVAMMLGTNDCKARFSAPASDIALGIERLILEARRTDTGIGGQPPHLLVIAPPPFAPLARTPFRDMFAGGEAKSAQLAGHYAQVAALQDVAFFDAGSVIISSPLDAIHLEAAEHGKLGRALAAEIQRLLGGE